MKQRITRELFEYWNRLRGERPAPDRGDIDPGAIRACLANAFVLAVDPDHGHPFRIAGTDICRLFARELTGTPFTALWAHDSRRAIADIVPSITNDTAGAVSRVIGRNGDGDTIELELILLPLAAGKDGACRMLGAFAIVAAPYWMGERPVKWLHAGPLQPVDSALASASLKEFADRRNQLGPGFVIYRANEEQRISRKNHG